MQGLDEESGGNRQEPRALLFIAGHGAFERCPEVAVSPRLRPRDTVPIEKSITLEVKTVVIPRRMPCQWVLIRME